VFFCFEASGHAFLEAPPLRRNAYSTILNGAKKRVGEGEEQRKERETTVASAGKVNFSLRTAQWGNRHRREKNKKITV